MASLLEALAAVTCPAPTPAPDPRFLRLARIREAIDAYLAYEAEHGYDAVLFEAALAGWTPESVWRVMSTPTQSN